ncbi:hypothetical protein EBU99_06690 [bacterium]|nr:hypothetical protein [bacterium]
MTSSASFAPETTQGAGVLQTSASAYGALLCTFKRGAGLALFRLEQGETLTESLARALRDLVHVGSQTAKQEALPLTSASYLIYSCTQSFFATCAGLTAENLAQLYSSILGFAGVDDSSVKSIGVVVGPGSFTGLRLGCAFANGLALGSPRPLWAVQGASQQLIESKISPTLEQPDAAFWGAVSLEHDDPFATFTSFGDILVSLWQWREGAATVVDVLEPEYGREPTPVLKLRQQQGSALS